MRLFDAAQPLAMNAVSTRPRRYRGDLSRVGVFAYQIDGHLIWQFRPPDEVLDSKSVDSMLDAVITIGHPEDDSDLKVVHGSVHNVDVNDDTFSISGDFTLVTKESDALARKGSPLSPMYDADVIEMAGVYEGRPYGYVQKNIRYTSVGLVDKARQGDSIKVFYQLSRDSGTTITESGIEYNASVITVPTMKNNTTRIADSAAALAVPVEAPVIPDSISTQTLEELESVALPETPPANGEPPVVVEVPAVVAEVPAIVAEVPPVIVETPADVEVVVSVEEETLLIAQITNEGGVLVNREYLNDVVAVAETVVSLGLMSLADAIYFGQADLAALQRKVLESSGITLRASDDPSTAYRVFAHSQEIKRQEAAAIAAALPAPEAPETRVTIGDAYATAQRARTVAAPTLPNARRTPDVGQTRPLVTHPATSTRTVVADSAEEPDTLVSFDSIGL